MVVPIDKLYYLKAVKKLNIIVYVYFSPRFARPEDIAEQLELQGIDNPAEAMEVAIHRNFI